MAALGDTRSLSRTLVAAPGGAPRQSTMKLRMPLHGGGQRFEPAAVHQRFAGRSRSASPQDLKDGVELEVAFGQETLEAGVLGLQLAQAAHLIGLELAVAPAPAVEGLSAMPCTRQSSLTGSSPFSASRRMTTICASVKHDVLTGLLSSEATPPAQVVLKSGGGPWRPKRREQSIVRPVAHLKTPSGNRNCCARCADGLTLNGSVASGRAASRTAALVPPRLRLPVRVLALIISRRAGCERPLLSSR